MPEAQHLSPQRLGREQGLRLLGYLLERGADEFSITVMALADTPAPFADAFEDELGPYELPMAQRPVISDRGSGVRAREVRLWRFSAESLARLSSFLDDGLFHCPPGPDGWLEDLTVYRRSQLVLGIVSHEREGVLRLESHELDEVSALHIVS